MNLQENIQRIKNIIEQTEPVQGKCGITRDCDRQDKEYSKQNATADRESAIQDRADQKYYSKQNKIALDINYDIFNQKRERSDREIVNNEYTKFLNNPSFQGQSSYNQEQKFAVLYKVFEELKRRPGVSYATRLKNRFNIPDLKSVTLEQLAGYANQMGWDKFIQWYQAGGPEIK